MTRKHIIEVAFREVYKNGFRSTGLSDILKKTGLSKGAFYYHFSNKMELGYAILDEIIEPKVDEWMLQPVLNNGDPLGGLIELFGKSDFEEFSIYLGCPLNNLTVEMAPVDQGFRERTNRIYSKWIEAYNSALKRGKSINKVNSKVNPESAATFIVASLAGMRGLTKSITEQKTLNMCQKELVNYLHSLKP